MLQLWQWLLNLPLALGDLYNNINNALGSIGFSMLDILSVGGIMFVIGWLIFHLVNIFA